MPKRPPDPQGTRQIGLRLPQETLDTLEDVRRHLAGINGCTPGEISKAQAVVWALRQVQELLDVGITKLPGKNSRK